MTDVPTTSSSLHDDAAVAAIVWAKLLPSSFTGSIICTSTPHLSRDVIDRALNLLRVSTISA